MKGKTTLLFGLLTTLAGAITCVIAGKYIAEEKSPASSSFDFSADGLDTEDEEEISADAE